MSEKRIVTITTPYITLGQLLKLANVIGNFSMFIPSGAVLPIVYRKLDSFRKVAGAGILLSLCIELLQLPFFQRTTDIDDLILNTAGVMVGYGIYSLVRKAAKRS